MLGDTMSDGARSVEELVDRIDHYLGDGQGGQPYPDEVKAPARAIRAQLWDIAADMTALRVVLDTDHGQPLTDDVQKMRAEARQRLDAMLDAASFTVFEGSKIEASFPATEEGWRQSIAYRDDTLKHYTPEQLAEVGVVDEA